MRTERLIELRRQRGWTQAELARRAGISQGNLSMIEAGQVMPTVATLVKLAGVFNIPLVALLPAPAGSPIPDSAAEVAA